MSLPRVAVLIPQPMRSRILDKASEARLAEIAEVVSAPDGVPQPQQLPVLLNAVTAAITGWGTPSLTEEVLEGAVDLKLVAHTAGSVHKLVPARAMEDGLQVSHAAAIIADAVAELVLGQTLRYLRRLDDADRRMKAGPEWMEIRNEYPGRLLGGLTVGVVGTGHVGRTVINLFRTIGSQVLACDPYLTSEQAELLGVTKVELDDIFSESDVVTLHAPALPDTEGIANADRFAMMKDGALLINMSRGSLVVEDDLHAELVRGRIWAALDVFSKEPLVAESRFRDLPNVYLSPHMAGQTRDTYQRQGRAMVAEVERLLKGETLKYAISPNQLSIMA